MVNAILKLKLESVIDQIENLGRGSPTAMPLDTSQSSSPPKMVGRQNVSEEAGIILSFLQAVKNFKLVYIYKNPRTCIRITTEKLS